MDVCKKVIGSNQKMSERQRKKTTARSQRSGYRKRKRLK